MRGTTSPQRERGVCAPNINRLIRCRIRCYQKRREDVRNNLQRVTCLQCPFCAMREMSCSRVHVSEWTNFDARTLLQMHVSTISLSYRSRAERKENRKEEDYRNCVLFSGIAIRKCKFSESVPSLGASFFPPPRLLLCRPNVRKSTLSPLPTLFSARCRTELPNFQFCIAAARQPPRPPRHPAARLPVQASQ